MHTKRINGRSCGSGRYTCIDVGPVAYLQASAVSITKELNWLIGRRSNLSIENRVLLYKTIIKPIWVYKIELWGCASKSNISVIQRSPSKILHPQSLVEPQHNRRLRRYWLADLKEN
ncbi:hypothetical protein B7P43_G00810 [Cryptotermes secundus]|uniref:Uncharacterized protein n=1 Tax=Cryptotermes secundus TaxID=105785 RepID=A0A2J7QSG3_9NEOP|nr:hypothetical protein B7P43_G00810 [Cryptotermes secundus]